MSVSVCKPPASTGACATDPIKGRDGTRSEAHWRSRPAAQARTPRPSKPDCGSSLPFTYLSTPSSRLAASQPRFFPLPVMQLPTCTGLRIRSLTDAHLIFHAVSLGRLPIVSRRLDIEERRYIHSGCVCVWEERNTCSDGSSVSTRSHQPPHAPPPRRDASCAPTRERPLNAPQIDRRNRTLDRR